MTHASIRKHLPSREKLAVLASGLVLGALLYAATARVEAFSPELPQPELRLSDRAVQMTLHRLQSSRFSSLNPIIVQDSSSKVKGETE